MSGLFNPFAGDEPAAFSTQAAMMEAQQQ